MKLTIEQHQLQTLLSRVTGAVAKRNTIPILGNVKMTATDVLSAEATDLDLSINAKQAATVTHQGATTVNAVMIAGIVGKLPKGSLVTLHHDGDYMHISSGRSKFKLSTLPAEDFPVMASENYEASISFDAEELKNAISKTSWAVSSDETRYYLNGILFRQSEGRATFTATDGHRLAHYKSSDSPEFPQVIIPAAAVKQFKDALGDGDAIVEVSQNKIRLTYDDVVITSKVVDGTYPQWERVVPSNLPNKVTTSSKDAADAIARVTTIATERTKAVKLTIGDGITFSVADPTGGTATETIDAEQDGVDVSIGLNSSYALSAFAQADKGGVTIAYGGGMDTVLVTYEKEPGLLAVVMPLRVN